MNNGTLKIMVIGGASVGKTTLCRQINHEDLVDVYYPAVPEDIINELDIDGQKIKFTVYDTQFGDYEKLRFVIYKQCQAFIFIIDISNPGSINEFEAFYNEAKSSREKEEDFIFVIVANKVDLRSKDNSQNLIPIEKITEIGNKYKSEVIEISAVDNIHINDTIENLIRRFINNSQLTTKKKERNCLIE
ncbi:hypothetical protein M9Y10_030177 [Tritrichomonas musculus]|uniref:Uncharacterized protein n=1 Tax=Tritrichomonas musculus TaxID=1915356 RepID=A0ABR2KSK2_9EUKA